MSIIGLGLDYSNICKDYNTVYLDRDNDDLATTTCMRKVLQWFNPLLTELMETFGYKLYRMNQDTAVPLSEVVKKRFFFYSLEKEIISQAFIFQKKGIAHNSATDWSKNSEDSLLIQNDDEGEGVTFFLEKNSKLHEWFIDKLSDCSLDEVTFQES